MLRFACAAVAILVIVAAASGFASRRAGTGEAIDDAERATAILARAVIEPALDPRVLAGDPAALADLDRLVRSRVLDDSLVRVKIWDDTGRIVYADEPHLIGSTYPLDDEDRAAMRTGGVDAEVTDLSRPENRFERPMGKLLEVYLGVDGPDGARLLFEAYFRYDAVTDAGSSIWWIFAPIAIGGLVLLQLVQIPLAWRMARHLRQRDIDRERLLRRALEASDAERRRIASDLHDGVVQDLAGVSYTMAALAERVDDVTVAGQLRDAATGTRRGVRALRSLLVEIYPPNLHSAGLATALGDLAAPLGARGIDATIDLDPDLPNDEAVERLVFRTTQEALRNVVRHAGAKRVHVSVRTTDHQVRLIVDDDGSGLPDTINGAGGDEHLGLRLLADLAHDAGGELELGPSPLGGARVALEVPVP